MTKEEIQSYLATEARGKPVWISLSDGKQYLVECPDYLVHHPVGDSVFLFNATGHYRVINRKEITSLSAVDLPGVTGGV